MFIHKIKSTASQFTRFSIIGFTNFFVDYGIFNFLILLLNPTSEFVFVIIRVLSSVCAIQNSYVWNRKWVFKSKEKHNQIVLKFLIVSIIGLLINTAVFSFCFWYLSNIEITESVSLNANIAFIFSTSVSLLWNFFGYKLAVFTK